MPARFDVFAAQNVSDAQEARHAVARAVSPADDRLVNERAVGEGRVLHTPQPRAESPIGGLGRAVRTGA